MGRAALAGQNALAGIALAVFAVFVKAMEKYATLMNVVILTALQMALVVLQSLVLIQAPIALAVSRIGVAATVIVQQVLRIVISRQPLDM